MAHDGAEPLTAAVAAGLAAREDAEARTPEARMQALAPYLNAGDRAYVAGETGAAHALYRQGLAQAEAFVAAGEHASGVREMMLTLYANISTVEERWHRLVGCLRYRTLAQALVWSGPQPAPADRKLLDGLKQNWAVAEATLRGLGNVAVLPLWHEVLRHWLTRMTDN